MNLGGAIPQGDQQAGAGAPPPQQVEQQQPQQQQVDLEKPTVSGALGRLGGRLGGLGRKKPQEQASSGQPQAQGAGGPASMMETTTELSGFSSAAVDASKFQVPAGFKQVESQMLKATQSR